MNGLARRIITLRQQRRTYADVAAAVHLSTWQVHRIIVKYRPDLTGAHYAQERNREIIKLRQANKTYAEIGKLLGLTPGGVQYIVKRFGPSLRGLRSARPIDTRKHLRNLELIKLHRQGNTYAEIGRWFNLNPAYVHRVVTGLDRVLTESQALLDLRSDKVLRNLDIIHLRQQHQSYAAIAKRVHLSPGTVRQILSTYSPSLAGRGHARRYPRAPVPKDDPRAYRRWYYHHVLKSKARLSTIKSGMMAPGHHRTTRIGRGPAMLATWTTLPIGLLQPDPQAQPHGEATVAEDDRLRRSIQKFGVLASIVVSSTGNGKYLIVDGLRRYRLARELGLTSIRCAVNPVWDISTRERIRFQLESTFKPLTAAERERQERRLQALEASASTA